MAHNLFILKIKINEDVDTQRQTGGCEKKRKEAQSCMKSHAITRRVMQCCAVTRKVMQCHEER
jgi:hypothetical protein